MKEIDEAHHYGKGLFYKYYFKKIDKYFNAFKFNFNDLKLTSEYVRYGIISK